MSMQPKGGRVALVGVGYSDVGRNTGLSIDELLIQAAKEALDDAGIAPADIDGYSTVGGDHLVDPAMLGMGPVNWFGSGMAAPAFSYSAIMSIIAISSGLCHTTMATRMIKQQPSLSPAALAARAGAEPTGISGDRQFLVPFGAGNPTQWAGMMTQRRMAEYGTTEADFAAHVVTQRYHASMNDDAIFRDPIDEDDYYAARYVSKPLRILDCDYPVDAGSAVIFTTEERARDMKQPAVFIDAYALSSISDLNFEILPDMVRTAPHHCADQLWSRTDLTPADVDTAQLYDGFTFITFEWLEALGLCGEGEAGSFVSEGHTRLGGSMPTNTDGGACNVGRRHGANFCIEAARQLRGQCGDRQVPDAEVAVWTNAVGPFAAAFVMTSS